MILVTALGCVEDLLTDAGTFVVALGTLLPVEDEPRHHNISATLSRRPYNHWTASLGILEALHFLELDCLVDSINNRQNKMNPQVSSMSSSEPCTFGDGRLLIRWLLFALLIKFTITLRQ
jgi:hypothetical protein